MNRSSTWDVTVVARDGVEPSTFQFSVRGRNYVESMKDKPTEPVVDYSRRCKVCGDVLMYCSCFMDFIDDLPDREDTQ